MKYNETKLAEAEQRVRALTEAVKPAYEVLAALHASVQWEIAPPIMDLIGRLLPRLEAALVVSLDPASNKKGDVT